MGGPGGTASAGPVIRCALLKNLAMAETVITLVHTGALGDTLLLAPLLRALRVRFPGARRNIVTRPAFGRVLQTLGLAEQWFDGNDPRHTLWFAAENWGDASAAPLEWTNCDILISAVSDGRDAWAANAARLAGPARRLFFNPTPAPGLPPGETLHVTEFHRRQLAELALPQAPGVPPARDAAGPVFVHPGSGGNGKNWPLPCFVALAERFKGAGVPVHFLFGEVEMERMPTGAIAAVSQAFPCAMNPPLDALPKLLRTGRGFVGNDSGVAHLAAAFGVPVAALFGPSDSEMWRPVGPRVAVVQPKGRSALMEHISLARVWEATAFLR